MKKIYETWRRGLEYLFTDDLNSYYTFFTTCLIECALLWVFAERPIAFPFTGVLIGCIFNVIICAALKGVFERLWVSILYIGVFIILAILGCFINPIISILIILIPFIITAMSLAIQEWLWSFDLENSFEGSLVLTAFYLAPYFVFVLLMIQISELPVMYKIILPSLYGLVIPYISIYEDIAATDNIFELAYENDWHIIKMWFMKNKKNKED